VVVVVVGGASHWSVSVREVWPPPSAVQLVDAVTVEVPTAWIAAAVEKEVPVQEKTPEREPLPELTATL
jgi:hypothetical protein